MKTLTGYILFALSLVYIGWTCNSTKNNDALLSKKIDAISQAADNLAATADRRVQFYKDSIVVLNKKVSANDSERNVQQGIKERLEEIMSNKIAQLTFSLKKYQTAKEGKDTVGRLINCDDIVIALDSLYGEAQLYKLTVDSLTTNGAARRGIDSLQIILRDAHISELQGQCNAAMQLLNESIKVNTDLRNALAKSKKGRWVLAGLAAVVSGIIVNQIK